MHRIMIVDDEESLRLTFALILKKKGYQAEAFPDYHSALAAFETGNFDLIFCDMSLFGKKTGLDLLETLNRRKAACPVIIMSGQDDDRYRKKALELGALAYATKPLRKEDLLFWISRAAEKNSS